MLALYAPELFSSLDMPAPATRAAVFDWDGVIINSASHHEISWQRLSAEVGKELPTGHFVRGFGMKNEVIIPKLLEWTQDPDEITRLSLRKEELYREVVVECGISPLPGVETWLNKLRLAGIPCIIGSSTHRLNITTTLQVLGLREYFNDIVSAEDVSHGKPDPEVFLKAAAKLKILPGDCVVFEDALVGIAAAKAAGMRVVAVTTTNTREILEAETDIVVDRLDELKIDSLWY